MTTSITATKARQNFFRTIEKANKPGASVMITVDGEVKVVMMPVEDFEGWQETLEIMADKNIMAGIREGLKGKRSYTEKQVRKMFDRK